MDILMLMSIINLFLASLLIAICFKRLFKIIERLETERNELIKENKELETEKNIYKHLREFNEKIADEKDDTIRTYTNIIMSLEEELKSVREEAYKSKKTVRKTTTSNKAK